MKKKIRSKACNNHGNRPLNAASMRQFQCGQWLVQFCDNLSSIAGSNSISGVSELLPADSWWYLVDSVRSNHLVSEMLSVLWFNLLIWAKACFTNTGKPVFTNTGKRTFYLQLNVCQCLPGHFSSLENKAISVSMLLSIYIWWFPYLLLHAHAESCTVPN